MSAKPRKHAPKVRVRGHVSINAYAVVSRAIEEGVAMGVSRWIRKGHAPDEVTAEMQASLAQHLDNEIGNALSEVLSYGDES